MLSLQGLLLLWWQGFDVRNFYIVQVWPKKKKKCLIISFYILEKGLCLALFNIFCFLLNQFPSRK